MTVLQHDPLSARPPSLQQLLRHRALPLSQRDKLELGASKAQFLSEGEDIVSWVSAGRKDEHHGRERGRLVVDLVEIEDGGLDVFLAHLVDDELLHGHGGAVGTEAAHETHLCELVQLLVPPQRKSFHLGGLQIIPDAEFGFVVGERLDETVEQVRLELAEENEVFPTHLWYPAVRPLLFRSFQRGVSPQEKVEQNSVQVSFGREDLARHLEREHELVHFEQPRACVVVHAQRQMVRDVTQPVLEKRVALGAL
mmetsp:Transcript_34282/g.74009  ORF Transcript_34282/g.74009 Transcript_34282/m.74009 type:complete len:253 (-) Transcript_34282:836-1594(-)